MNTTDFKVFDHDDPKLVQHLEDIFSRVPTTRGGKEKDIEAADILLHTAWRIAFVHILDDPWQNLCLNTPESRVLVRFSTEGFRPAHPEGAKALCLRCVKKIDQLKPEDIRALLHSLNDESTCNSIRNRVIPKPIRHLLLREEPHRLRALHVLMQGILASWASNSGHKLCGKARRCLRVAAIPPLPSRKIELRSTIRKGLGLSTDVHLSEDGAKALLDEIALELGVEGEEYKPPIDKLVASICKGESVAAFDENDEAAVFGGFSALDEVFKKL